jgi:hypothetical protein
MYFLFGSTAIQLHDKGELINAIKDDGFEEYAIFHYHEEITPSELLEGYDGWKGFAVIEKDDFEALKEAMNQANYDPNDLGSIDADYDNLNT